MWVGQAAQQAQQGVSSHRHAHRVGQAGAGATGQRDGDRGQGGAQRGLERACGVVSPSICSANVRLRHPGAWQTKRRTVSRRTTGWPAKGVSARCRRYRPCTRPDSSPHPGHAASDAADRTSMTTRSSLRCIRSATPLRCGRRSTRHPESRNIYLSQQPARATDILSEDHKIFARAIFACPLVRTTAP